VVKQSGPLFVLQIRLNAYKLIKSSHLESVFSAKVGHFVAQTDVKVKKIRTEYKFCSSGFRDTAPPRSWRSWWYPRFQSGTGCNRGATAQLTRRCSWSGWSTVLKRVQAVSSNCWWYLAMVE